MAEMSEHQAIHVHVVIRPGQWISQLVARVHLETRMLKLSLYYCLTRKCHNVHCILIIIMSLSVIKTDKMAFEHSNYNDRPEHLTSLIRVIWIYVAKDLRLMR